VPLHRAADGRVANERPWAVRRANLTKLSTLHVAVPTRCAAFLEGSTFTRECLSYADSSELFELAKYQKLEHVGRDLLGTTLLFVVTTSRARRRIDWDVVS